MIKSAKPIKYGVMIAMARLGVDYETVKHTATKLLSQGIAPSVQKIREVLGTGSNTTIAEHLKMWRDEYAKKAIHHLPPNMPKELISAFEILWQTAMEQAQNQLAEYKLAVENQCEETVHKQQAAEKSLDEIKFKMNELSALLTQEISKNQKQSIELAVTTERLTKQEEAFASQKNQYEDRLKRVYDEKDISILQCNQLQIEISALQERIILQTNQHHDAHAKQNSLHEQSENRWMKMVDQAKLETKEVNNRLEKIRDNYDAKIVKLQSELSGLHQCVYESNAHLNSAQERIVQLKQEVDFIEGEYIKSQATIITLQENRGSVIDASKKFKKISRSKTT